MNTIRWTCKECGTVNVYVFLENETEADCRKCGNLAELTITQEVEVHDIYQVMTTH